MIHEVHIKPKHGHKAPHAWLTMEFIDGKHEFVVKQSNKQIIKRTELIPGEEVDLMKLYTNGSPFKLTYDDSIKEGINPENDIQRRKAYLLKHCHKSVRVVSAYVKDPSNPGQKIPVYSNENKRYVPPHLFDYVDSTVIYQENVKLHNRRIGNINKVLLMTPKERQNLMFLFGRDPLGKKDSEIFLELTDFDRGLVVSRDKFDTIKTKDGESPRTHMDYFADIHAGSNPQLMLETLVRKAMMIPRSSHEPPVLVVTRGGQIYLGNTIVGTDFAEVVNRAAKDEKLYDYLKREVLKLEQPPEEDMPDVMDLLGQSRPSAKVAQMSTAPDDERAEEKRLQSVERCRSLYRMKVSDSMSQSTLDDLEAEGRKLWTAVSFAGIKPLIDTFPEWDFNRVKEEYELAKPKSSNKEEGLLYTRKRLQEIAEQEKVESQG